MVVVGDARQIWSIGSDYAQGGDDFLLTKSHHATPDTRKLRLATSRAQ